MLNLDGIHRSGEMITFGGLTHYATDMPVQTARLSFDASNHVSGVDLTYV